jgi:hypothetical protein
MQLGNGDRGNRDLTEPAARRLCAAHARTGNAESSLSSVIG